MKNKKRKNFKKLVNYLYNNQKKKKYITNTQEQGNFMNQEETFIKDYHKITNMNPQMVNP